MALDGLDKSANQPIVDEITTPPAGAINTDRGLTGHAEGSSTAADSNTNLASPSRQSLPSAVDDFSVGQVEYVAPPDAVVRDFVRKVCERLDEQHPGMYLTTEVMQGLREFLNVVINIQVKQANRQGGEAYGQDEDNETST